MTSDKLFIIVILVSVAYCARGQCPEGWLGYSNFCWYFSRLEPMLSWSAAESWCQQNNGHLASFSTVEERDWAVQQNMQGSGAPRWWIGLNDIETEGSFVWSDGTTYDRRVSNWKPLEPNNAYLENCVEIFIGDLVYDERWNDQSCEVLHNFVCKTVPGNVNECSDGYQYNNERCYAVIDLNYQWFDAQQYCKNQGANLVSIGSGSEQSFVQTLISSNNQNYWIGLSDTDTPGTLQWKDPNQPTLTFNKWSNGQPRMDYYGSTCTEINYALGFSWDTARCSVERKFVCEKGKKASCPPQWLYLEASGKCYEFVTNPNRVQTWIASKEICSTLGGGLLKIESQEEETFVGSVLKSYTSSGHPLVYFGASDIGHDDRLTWWDQTNIAGSFWSTNMPQLQSGKDDCGALYTGKSNNNWETSNCFEQRAYICEIPEGQTIPSFPVVSVDGKCENGWRHFQGKCYLFREEAMTQSSAESYCVQNGGHLTSILDEFEQSFIGGYLTQKSWIGFQQTGGTKSWTDGETYGFENWSTGEPGSPSDCGAVEMTGDWFGESCSQNLPFVCKTNDIPTDTVTIPPPTYVPDLEKCGGDGWISDPSSNRCYKVNLDSRSWSDARYACMVGGGDLAAINSPVENDHVHALIMQIPTELYFWIGGNDLNNFNIELLDQGWKWSDGSAFNFINWASGQPDNQDTEDCMYLYVGDERWYDGECYQYRASVCEKVGNVDNIIGQDVTDDECKSHEDCCFRHLGAEYGGTLPNTALTASSIRDRWFNATRGRLNSPADVIILDYENEIFVGNGHGAWLPAYNDQEGSWLQVDFPYRAEVKGIITQGRNGIIVYTDRQWVTSYKVAYSQDADGGKWEFVSDSNGQPVIFKGNSDQDTQVTNIFPRALVARHMRCYPVTWFESPCLRLEYIGCKSSCLNKLGMNSGLIKDSMITASSYRSGFEAKQARAPVDQDECKSSDTDGSDYRGWISKSLNRITCQAWSSQEPNPHSFTPEKYPDGDLRSNYCRNPNGRSSPWCITTRPDYEWELCDIPVCPSFTPSGWIPNIVNQLQYLQVELEEYFKISGITLYKPSQSAYVTTYYVSFSDDGNSYFTYQDQTGNNHVFTGLDSIVNEYTDIMREPVSTKYVRILPQTWVGEPRLQFELLGCYVESRITCSDVASLWKDEGSTFQVECPPGCVQDVGRGLVYGTDIYTLNSAVCPAAVHAGKLINNNGGMVIVQQQPGQSAYAGSSRHGITSQNYGEYSASFAFSGDSLRCDEGWLAWKDHCYLLSMKGVLKTWQEARADCVSKGGDLVSIWTEGENSFVEATIYVADLGGDVWIGLNDIETEDYYLWSDGSPVTMTKWFFDEPKSGRHRCVNMYRFEAYWNDKDCDETLPYMCKKNKQLLPPLPTDSPIQDEGCDVGWKAYGSSCYKASTDVLMYIYSNRICEESNGKLATINDDFEQAFVYSLVLNTLPLGLGYTSWIGLSAKTSETGSLYYEWENGEAVTYTHWDRGEPEVRYSCAFPFVYKGVSYYECTTFDHPARLENTPWCSIDPVYSGGWINCNTGYEYGCTFMDDNTGFWQIDICGENRYYVCEKDRIGYTDPITTTPSTSGSCSQGWYGNQDTPFCYQINEKANRTERATWKQALDYCRAQNADLVSIHSTQEEQIILSFVEQAGVYSYTSFWLGLNNLESSSGYQWTDGTPVSYTNWNYGEPNDHNGNENCVESGMTSGAMWNDLNCDSARNWICKIEKGTVNVPPPTLPPPRGTESTQCGTDGTWILFTTDYQVEKCYLFVEDTSFGWEYANQDCITRGGNLVSIHSADENSFVLGRTAKISSNVMWIGLKDTSSIDGRSFQWTDSSLVDYINWAPGEPNNYLEQEDCGAFYAHDGLWNDDNCGVQMPYICEKFLNSNPGEVVPTPPVTGNCPPGFTAYGNKCWFFSSDSSDTLSWYDATERCSNMSAQPATIQDSYEQSFVTSQLKLIGKNMWVGLSGRNSLQYVWHDQSELTYTNWEEFEPNGNSGDEACVEVKSSTNAAGKWADTNCNNLKPYSCYVMRSGDYPANTPAPSTCENGYNSWGDGCYMLMDKASSRSEASKACQAQGSDNFLMSINDVFENNLYKSLFLRDVGSSDKLWTGLTFTAVATETGEFSATFKWDNGWPVDYTNWAAMEPNKEALSSGSGCVQINNQGYWEALSASACEKASLPFVCKQSLTSPPTTPDPGVGNCDPGFLSYGSNCYYIEIAQSSSNYRSWHEAVYECESRGASLASFHSEAECNAIISSFGGNYYHNLFIGLSSDGYTGWKWADGTGVDFFNWGPNEPNGQGNGEDCVEMYPWDGKWNDVDCLAGRGYICKKPKQYSSCSEVDPSDRIECGSVGMDESVCYRRSCCWDPSYSNENFSGCYYPPGIGPSGIPITDVPPGETGGLSAGEIAGIVIGVLASVLLVIGIAMFCKTSDKAKTLSLPSMPSMPSMPTRNKGETKSHSNVEAGFDNPVASISTSTDISGQSDS